MNSSSHILPALAAAALLLSACSSGGGDSPSQDVAAPGIPAAPPPAPAPPPAAPPPTGTYTGVDPAGSYEVRATKEIVFTTGLIDRNNPQDVDVLLDLFEPDEDLTGGTLPAVVLIHGGGFTAGSRNHPKMQLFGEEFAKQGYIAVAIDYRLRPQDPVLSGQFQNAFDAMMLPAGWEDGVRAQMAALEETLRAIEWINEYAAANDFEIEGFALLGPSAGALTAINFAYALDDLGVTVPEIGAVVGLWGGIGLATTAAITVDEAPIILIHGTDDTVVPFDASQQIADRAVAIGLPNELIANAGAGHSFSDNEIFDLETMPGSGISQARRVMDFVNVALLVPSCLRAQGVIDGCDLP